MRRDHDRVRQLRARCAASAFSQTRRRAEFAGFSPETFSVCCRVGSFLGPGTRPAGISLTLRASATGCAFMFCAANLRARYSLASSSTGFLPTPIDFLMINYHLHMHILILYM